MPGDPLTVARPAADPIRLIHLPDHRVALIRPLSRAEHVVKRVLDVAFSLLLIVLTAPLMLTIAAIVRLDSPGPALFRQERLGEGERRFRFVKFRTMYVDARQRFPDLYAYRFAPSDVDTMYFKLAEDPRLTRFGRHLRRTSLDELPNLFNVLRGDMSLVGPRPEIPDMLPYYRGAQRAKFAVKPGLTGLAQVSGRNILRFQRTIELDLEYVRNRSIWLDLRILARTPLVVVRMLGAL